MMMSEFGTASHAGVVSPTTFSSDAVIGVTAAPFIRSGLAVSLDLARRAEQFGYGSFWVAEVSGTEAFKALGAASAQTGSVGLGSGVLSAQVRTPPLLAMAAATLQALNPDREVLVGVGVSSPTVAADWHGTAYPPRPVAYMREFIALLRLCLSGEPVTFSGEHFQARKSASVWRWANAHPRSCLARWDNQC
jgi:alkanesulfonate monooxygenase SsuD/methylene tetrahydromethanopterin reductase-like flavin-dependent oxidoreductase (luciferase family)